MVDQQESKAEWAPCPAGEISRTVRRVRRRRQTALAVQVTTVGAAVLLVGFVLRQSFGPKPPSQSPNFGGITCAECQKYAEAYLEGRLSKELLVKMETHLDLCVSCHEKLQKMRSPTTSQVHVHVPRSALASADGFVKPIRDRFE